MNSTATTLSDDKRLRIKEAAPRLNVSEKTVRRYCEQGKLLSKKDGGFRIIRESELQRFMESPTATQSAAGRKLSRGVKAVLFLVVDGDPLYPCDPWGDDPSRPHLEVYEVAQRSRKGVAVTSGQKAGPT